MVLLCTTIACPISNICIVTSPNFPVVQKFPCLLDQDLLTMKGGSLALVRIINVLQQLVPVCRECLYDQGESGKVNSQAIIVVKNSTFEVFPHCLNYHSRLLPWDGVGICQLCPELPFVREYQFVHKYAHTSQRWFLLQWRYISCTESRWVWSAVWGSAWHSGRRGCRQKCFVRRQRMEGQCGGGQNLYARFFFFCLLPSWLSLVPWLCMNFLGRFGAPALLRDIPAHL